MKLLKRILIILLCIAAMLVAVFRVDRYGWKLGGFFDITIPTKGTDAAGTANRIGGK